MSDFIRVDEWVSTEEDNIVRPDGKLIVIPFDKIYKAKEIGVLNTFNIIKKSYVDKLDMITHYINYFIKFYDYDNELLVAYAKLKFMIDDTTRHYSTRAFIALVYDILYTDSIVEKIVKMTEDNYYIDVSSKSDIKYNESLEFTNDHAKVLMQISVAIKLMVPILFHFISKLKTIQRTKKGQGYQVPDIKENKIMYPFYAPLFDIFKGPNGDIEVYNKLYISTWSKVNENYNRNRVIWDQRDIYGETELTKMNSLLKNNIICETIFKYVFDYNLINLNHVVTRRQLSYFLLEQYDHTRVEISSKKDAVTGLSGADKLEMSATKTDESMLIMSELNIKRTIAELERRFAVTVTDDEIRFYRNRIDINKFRVNMTYYFYAKYFGGYTDLNMLNRTNYLRLLIMLKKRLRYHGFVYLPEILTANIIGRINTRTIRNEKFISKIESSAMYQSLISDKYAPLKELKEVNKSDVILTTLSTLINTTFAMVDYDNPDACGTPIVVDPDAVSDEFLQYLSQM